MPATWGSYQSVIQTAVALNLGYSGLRVLFRDRIPSVAKAHAAYMERLKNHRPQKGASGGPTPADIGKFLNAKGTVTWVMKWDRRISGTSTLFAILSGGISLILLVASADYFECPLNDWWRAIIMIFGYVWLAVVTLSYLSFSFLIQRYAEPVFGRASDDRESD